MHAENYASDFVRPKKITGIVPEMRLDRELTSNYRKNKFNSTFFQKYVCTILKYYNTIGKRFKRLLYIAII